ncbi:hypothetical protein [Ekhidna sp.]|uniref:hypothetical protein n=2 Tax=Ekhidna sp. TaxID=2608089 RepID=UPI003CCB99B3
MKRYFKLISKQYRTQISMPPSGDVPIDTIKKIRKDLALDDENGVDSAYFYGKESQKIDDFINSYRQTLSRLAKL